MVQLVFILALYILQIFAAVVTMFLSLHVKFTWSKVVLMHDIASICLPSVLLSLVHFYFESLKISEIFQREKMFRKMFQGGSSSKSSPRLAIREPNLEPPWEALMRPCDWPSDSFMVQAGIKSSTCTCIMLGWRNLYQISAPNTIISLILLCGNLLMCLIKTLMLSSLTYMKTSRVTRAFARLDVLYFIIFF
jgi:hypothetical protein